MNAHTSFTVSLVSILAVAGAVACSSAANDTSSSSDAIEQAPPPPAAACTAADDSNAAASACITCCLDATPTVKPVVQQAQQCLEACGESDSTCQDACFAAYDQACSGLGDACQQAETCADGCFPKNGGGNGQNGGGNGQNGGGNKLTNRGR